MVGRHLYHGVRLRQRVHTVTISRSAVIHAERLPIEPRPTAHTMGYRRESSRIREGKPTRMRRLCLKTSEAEGRGGLGITSSSEEVYELML